MEVYTLETKQQPQRAILNLLRDFIAHGIYPDTSWMDSLELQNDLHKFSDIQKIKYDLARGLLARSQKSYRQAFALLIGIYPQRDSLHPSDRAYLLNELGVICYYNLGMPYEHYFDEELVLLEQGDYSYPTVKSYFYNQASIQRNKGELDQALYFAKQGLYFIHQGKTVDSIYLPYFVNVLANVYFEKKDYDSARKQYRAALSLTSDSATRAIYGENLARCLVYCDSAAVGEPLVKENIRAGLNLSKSYNVLGLIKLNLRKYVEAEEAYQKLLDLTPATQYYDRVEALRGVAISQYYRQEYRTSIQNFEQCLRWIDQSMTNHAQNQSDLRQYLVETIRTHAWLAMNDMELELGAKSQSFDHFLEHYSIIDSMMLMSRRLMSESLQRDLSNEYKQIFVAGIDRVRRALKAGVSDPLKNIFLGRILQWFDYNKAGILDRHRSLILNDSLKAQAEDLVSLQSRLIQYQKNNRAGPHTRWLKKIQDSIESMKWYQPEPLILDYESVVKHIPEHTAVLAFIETRDLYFAYALTKDTLCLDTIHIDQMLQTDLKDYYQLLSKEPHSSRTQLYDRLARRLYNVLLGKFDTLLSPKLDWLVLGDGLLDNFPFESLIHPLDPAKRFEKLV